MSKSNRQQHNLDCDSGTKGADLAKPLLYCSKAKSFLLVVCQALHSHGPSIFAMALTSHCDLHSDARQSSQTQVVGLDGAGARTFTHTVLAF